MASLNWEWLLGHYLDFFLKMEEERPPTKEEIDELRERTKDFVAENGEGNVIFFCAGRFAKTVQFFI